MFYMISVIKNKVRAFKAIGLIEDSGLFDLEYYCFYAGKKMELRSAIAHYLSVGVKQGLNPCEQFSTNYYLTEYRDVLESGANPLVHFIRDGAKEGRSCHNSFNSGRALEIIASNGLQGQNYLSAILKLVESGKVELEQVYLSNEQFITDNDLKDIEASGFFDSDYYVSAYPDVYVSGMNALHHYLHFGFRENRNPSTFFDTDFYRRKNMSEGDHICPLLHFVRLDDDSRPLCRPIYGLDLVCREKMVHEPKKSAIHVHLYYPDVLEELLPKLTRLDSNIDILVSVSGSSKGKLVEKILTRSGLKNNVVLRDVENIGRDIAPWFVGFSDSWSKYDYVCHLHSKKSPHTTFGRRWRSYLFDQLIGSQERVDAILGHFEGDENTGFLFPDNYHEIKPFVGWNGNESDARSFLGKADFENVDFEQLNCEFAAGSMCWVRTSAFSPLNKAFLSLPDFDSESDQQEGTLAHVLERCLPLIPQLNGFQARKFYAPIIDVPSYRDEWEKGEDFPPNYTRDTASRWQRDTPDIALNERVELAAPYPYFNSQSLNIHWVIPDFGLGAGGHMTIFRMVRYLEEFGHRQVLWVQNANNYSTPSEAKACIQEHYQFISDDVIVQFLPEDVARISGDVVIATDCWSVFPVMAMPRFKERFYFIQDWEPQFHPVGDSHLIADLTYSFGLNALCAGDWLHSKASSVGLWARQWELASDDRYYFPKETTSERGEQVTIAFYAREYTPRRAVRLGISALKELHSRNIDFHVIFFGQDNVNFNVDFSHEYLGILTPEELGKLYRSVDIGMVFSATNYSLIPLEMMACGLPLLELDVESTQAVFNTGFVQMAKADPWDIAENLKFMIENPDECNEKAVRALEFVQTLNWRSSAEKIQQAILERLSLSAFTPVTTAALMTPRALDYPNKAAVIIPTFNAGDIFKGVLDSLLNQSCDFDFQIIIVDSGSTDQTLELIRGVDDARVTLYQIPNTEFQHGRTRNYAISKTQAEFISVITQDATPKNSSWLKNLISAFEYNDNVAGVFGAHEAYPEHSPYVQRDIKRVFERFDMFGEVYNWQFAEVEPGSKDWQMTLQYYSDNNSCLRRSVWEQVPYPEIDWGEDQVWAWMIVQLGLTKAYAGNAIVYHSHDDTYEIRFKTAKIEGAFFKSEFGLRLYPESSSIKNIIDNEQVQDRSYGQNLCLDKELIENQVRMIEASHLGRYQGVDLK